MSAQMRHDFHAHSQMITVFATKLFTILQVAPQVSTLHA
jgi:hypothetical protein